MRDRVADHPDYTDARGRRRPGRSTTGPSRSDRAGMFGASCGALAGAMAGLFASLGLIGAPAVGELYGVSWIGASVSGALLGAALGGASGSLTGILLGWVVGKRGRGRRRAS